MTQHPRPVVVVGGLNIDTLASVTVAETVHFSSNPGRTVTVPGGVGRNVAECLALLGTPVRLVGAVGRDLAGDSLLEGLVRAGVDVTGVRRTDDRTGTYTAVLDHRGDLVVGVADMASTDALGPEDLPDDLLDGAGWLVVDGNLGGATVARALALAAAADVPVALDPVGVAKAARIDRLAGVHTFTPNVDELAAWSRRPGIAAGVRAAHEQGVAVVWLREGPAGSRLFRSGLPGDRIRLPGAAVRDVTGAGDAMLAGYVHRMTRDGDPLAAAWVGAAAAWLTVASPYPVRPDLSEALVERTLAELRHP